MSTDLTPRQARFVDAYLTNGYNGKQAAIEAGYSPNAAEVTASKMLRRGKVADAVAARQQVFTDEKEDLRRRLLDWLERNVFFDISEVWDDDEQGPRLLSELPVEMRQLIAEVQVTETQFGETVKTVRSLKLPDRQKAAQLLMKHLGMLNEKVEHSGSIAVSLPQLVERAEARRRELESGS